MGEHGHGQVRGTILCYFENSHIFFISSHYIARHAFFFSVLGALMFCSSETEWLQNHHIAQTQTGHDLTILPLSTGITLVQCASMPYCRFPFFIFQNRKLKFGLFMVVH